MCSALTQGEGTLSRRTGLQDRTLSVHSAEDNQFIMGRHNSRIKPFESCHHKDARYHCTSFYPEEQHAPASLAHISVLR